MKGRWNMVKNKRSQMEMLGIAIVVVLVAFGMLFVVKFMLMRPPSSAKTEFLHRELASNTLSALLLTTTDCKNVNIRDLLIDCAENNEQVAVQICCEESCRNLPNQNEYDFDDRSCGKVHSTITRILDQTLSQYGKSYSMNAKKNIGNTIFVDNSDPNSPDPLGAISDGDCSRKKKTGTFHFQTQTGPLIIELSICD